MGKRHSFHSEDYCAIVFIIWLQYMTMHIIHIKIYRALQKVKHKALLLEIYCDNGGTVDDKRNNRMLLLSSSTGDVVENVIPDDIDDY